MERSRDMMWNLAMCLGPSLLVLSILWLLVTVGVI